MWFLQRIIIIRLWTQDGNVIDFYHNGIDTIEIQNDTNSGLYGYFPGFNGIYRKTEELSPTANIKDHGDVGMLMLANYIIPYSDIQSIAEMGSLAKNMSSEDLRLAKNGDLCQAWKTV